MTTDELAKLAYNTFRDAANKRIGCCTQAAPIYMNPRVSRWETEIPITHHAWRAVVEGLQRIIANDM